MIPDHEEITTGLEGPTQASIRAELSGLRIVLFEAREHEIWGEGVHQLELHEVLLEIAFRQISHVALSPKDFGTILCGGIDVVWPATAASEGVIA